MAYCANCGKQAEGRFCPSCGAVMPGAAPGSTAAPPPPNAYPPPPGGPYIPPSGPYVAQPAGGLGMEENLAAALCYIPIVGLIFLLLDPYKQNRNIRFHAWQAVLYAAAWFVVMFVLSIALGILVPFGMWGLWSLLRLVQLVLLIVLILCAVKAYQGSRLVLPIIGQLAEKQAH